MGVRMGVRVWTRGIVVGASLTAWAGTASAGEKHFDGPYVGIEICRHNVIGGSLLDGIDTLRQESRAVLNFPIGWRKQLGGGFVVGTELSYGLADGNLRLSDPAAGLQVDYANDDQRQIGVLAGHTLGAAGRGLLFGYVGELSRSFAVTIRAGDQLIRQNDEQGLLRYGMGGELSLWRGLLLRGTLGSSRARFDGETNLQPATKLDGSFGLVFQF